MAIRWDTRREFIRDIRSKHPETKQVDDQLLYDDFVTQFPVYDSQIAENFDIKGIPIPPEEDRKDWKDAFAEKFQGDISVATTFTGLEDKVEEAGPVLGTALGAVEFFTGAPGLIESAQIFRAGEAVKNETATEEQQAIITSLAIDSKRPTSKAYRVWNTALEVPQYVVAFLAGGVGLKAIGNTILGKGAKEGAKATGKAVGGKVVQNIATELTKDAWKSGIKSGLKNVAIKAPVRSALMPQIWIDEQLTRMTPEFQAEQTDVDQFKIHMSDEGDDFWPALAKAYANTTIESFSEEVGGMLPILGTIWGKKGAAPFKAAILNRFTKISGNHTMKSANDVLRQGGWHGVLGEMFEERVGDVLRTATPGLEGELIPSFDQLTTEALAFSIPGAAMNIAHYARGGEGLKQMEENEVLFNDLTKPVQTAKDFDENFNELMKRVETQSDPYYRGFKMAEKAFGTEKRGSVKDILNKTGATEIQEIVDQAETPEAGRKAAKDYLKGTAFNITTTQTDDERDIIQAGIDDGAVQVAKSNRGPVLFANRQAFSRAGFEKVAKENGINLVTPINEREDLVSSELTFEALEEDGAIEKLFNVEGEESAQMREQLRAVQADPSAKLEYSVPSLFIGTRKEFETPASEGGLGYAVPEGSVVWDVNDRNEKLYGIWLGGQNDSETGKITVSRMSSPGNVAEERVEYGLKKAAGKQLPRSVEEWNLLVDAGIDEMIAEASEEDKPFLLNMKGASHFERASKTYTYQDTGHEAKGIDKGYDNLEKFQLKMPEQAVEAIKESSKVEQLHVNLPDPSAPSMGQIVSGQRETEIGVQKLEVERTARADDQSGKQQSFTESLTEEGLADVAPDFLKGNNLQAFVQEFFGITRIAESVVEDSKKKQGGLESLAKSLDVPVDTPASGLVDESKLKTPLTPKQKESRVKFQEGVKRAKIVSRQNLEVVVRAKLVERMSEARAELRPTKAKGTTRVAPQKSIFEPTVAFPDEVVDSSIEEESQAEDAGLDIPAFRRKQAAQEPELSVFEGFDPALIREKHVDTNEPMEPEVHLGKQITKVTPVGMGGIKTVADKVSEKFGTPVTTTTAVPIPAEQYRLARVAGRDSIHERFKSALYSETVDADGFIVILDNTGTTLDLETGLPVMNIIQGAQTGRFSSGTATKEFIVTDSKGKQIINTNAPLEARKALRENEGSTLRTVPHVDTRVSQIEQPIGRLDYDQGAYRAIIPISTLDLEDNAKLPAITQAIREFISKNNLRNVALVGLDNSDAKTQTKIYSNFEKALTDALFTIPSEIATNRSQGAQRLGPVQTPAIDPQALVAPVSDRIQFPATPLIDTSFPADVQAPAKTDGISNSLIGSSSLVFEDMVASGAKVYNAPDGAKIILSNAQSKIKSLEFFDQTKRELIDLFFAKTERETVLSEVFDLPELYEAYPDLRDVRVIFDETMKIGTAGYNEDGSISVGTDAFLDMKKRPGLFKTIYGDQLLNVIIHESQHWIQEKEGFEQGRSPSIGLREYLLAPGEIEARVETALRELNPQERAVLDQSIDNIDSMLDIEDGAFKRLKKRSDAGIDLTNVNDRIEQLINENNSTSNALIESKDLFDRLIPNVTENAPELRKTYTDSENLKKAKVHNAVTNVNEWERQTGLQNNPDHPEWTITPEHKQKTRDMFAGITGFIEKTDDTIIGMEKVKTKELFDAYNESASRYPGMPKAEQISKELQDEWEKVRQDVNEELKGLTFDEYIRKIEDYVMHSVVFKNPAQADDFIQRYATTTKAAKKRSYPTLVEMFDAMQADIESVNADAIAGYKQWNERTWRDVTKKIFFNNAMLMQDADGAPFIIAKPIKQIEIEDEDGKKKKVNLKKFFIAPATWNKYFTQLKKYAKEFDFKLDSEGMPDTATLEQLGYTKLESPFIDVGDIWVKEGEAERVVKDALNYGKLNTPLVKGLERFNAWSKTSLLTFSAFHAFSLVESFIASHGLNTKNPAFHPIQAKKDVEATYDKFISDPAFGGRWIRRGLQVTQEDPNVVQGLVNQDIQKGIDLLSSRDKKWGTNFTEKGQKFFDMKKSWDRFLWQKMHAPMKLLFAEKALQEMKENMNVRGLEVSEDQEREMMEQISSLVNNAFGGQDWTRYNWSTPLSRQVLHLGLFAPDWTFSSANISGVTRAPILRDILRTPELSAFEKDTMLKKYWPAMIALVITGLPNALQAIMYAGFGDEEEGDVPFTFMNEDGRKLHIDITPLLRKMDWVPGIGYRGGKTGNRRVFMRWGKQATEVSEGWLQKPLRTLMNKSSSVSRAAWEQTTGLSTGLWDLPFKDTGLTGVLEVEGSFWDSRAGFIARKFVPFSLTSVLDGKSAIPTFFAPVSRGASFGSLFFKYRSVLEGYANPGVWGKISSDERKLEKMGELTEALIDSAKRNGVDGRNAFFAAAGATRTQYEKDLADAINRNLPEKQAKISASVLRLNEAIDRIASDIKQNQLG